MQDLISISKKNILQLVSNDNLNLQYIKKCLDRNTYYHVMYYLEKNLYFQEWKTNIQYSLIELESKQWIDAYFVHFRFNRTWKRYIEIRFINNEYKKVENTDSMWNAYSNKILYK